MCVYVLIRDVLWDQFLTWGAFLPLNSYETTHLPSYLMKIQAVFLDLASGLHVSRAVVAAVLWGRREEECFTVTNAPEKAKCKSLHTLLRTAKSKNVDSTSLVFELVP